MAPLNRQSQQMLLRQPQQYLLNKDLDFVSSMSLTAAEPSIRSLTPVSLAPIARQEDELLKD